MELSSYDAQRICDDLKEILNYDINFVNSEGKMIASTNKKRIGIYHSAAKNSIDERKKVTINKEDESEIYIEGINSPIFFKDEIIGVISINGKVSEVEKYIDIITKMTQIYISGLAFEKDLTEEKLQNKYIIEGIMFNQNLDNINEVLSKNGIRLYLGSYLVIFDLDLPESDARRVFNNILNKNTVGLFGAIVGKRLVCIMISPDITKLKYFINKIIEKNLLKYSYKIGVGTQVKSEEFLFESYKHAQAALVSISNDYKNISIYEELRFELVLSSMRPDIKRDVLDKTVNKIPKDKVKNYMEILDVYLKNNSSITKSAEQLFIHKNTIQYRLNKIYSITGYNPRNFEDASFLYLAYLIYEQEKNIGGHSE